MSNADIINLAHEVFPDELTLEQILALGDDYVPDDYEDDDYADDDE